MIPTTVASLSDSNDYATKQYCDAHAGTIDNIQVNNVSQSIVNKDVNITVPTKVSDITNDSGFQTASDVNAAISAADHLRYLPVAALPAVADADENTVYAVPNGGTNGNSRTEYILNENKDGFEIWGTSDIDLSGYALDSDFVEVTNAEITSLVSAVFSSST